MTNVMNNLISATEEDFVVIIPRWRSVWTSISPVLRRYLKATEINLKEAKDWAKRLLLPHPLPRPLPPSRQLTIDNYRLIRHELARTTYFISYPSPLRVGSTCGNCTYFTTANGHW